MTRHPHSILVLLIMLSAGTLGMVTNAWTFPVCIGLVLLLNLLFGLHLQSKPDILRKVALGIPFAIWFRLLAKNGVHEGFTRTVQIDVLFMVGFYALAYATYHMLCVPVTRDTAGLLRNPTDLPLATGAEAAKVEARAANYRAEALGGAIVAMALAGVLPKSNLGSASNMGNAINGALLVFIGLVFVELRRTHKLLFARGKPSHLAMQVIALAVLVGAAVVIQDTFVSRVPQLSRAFLRQLRQSQNATASYRKSTTLGSINLNKNSEQANEIVVTVWSEVSFPYLRGGVNDTYRDRQWSAVQENNSASRIDERDGRTVFAFKNLTNKEVAYAGTIYTAPEFRDTLFLPLGTFRVSSFAEKVLYSPAYTAQIPDKNTEGGYGFYEPTVARGETDEDIDNFTPEDLQVPENLREPLRKIALTIMDPAESAGRNGARIASHFAANFTYSLSTELNGGKDPVLEFLEDKKAGHCEYFASAAVLLLRSMKIPARYVTGYVAMEAGLNGSCFVARRKDAHAWAEFYTKEGGWQMLETTPPEGVPAPLTLGTWDRLREYVEGMWNRVIRVLQFGGLKAVFANVMNLIFYFAEVIPLWAWIAVALVGFVWSQRDRIRKIARNGHELALTARARSLQRELINAERALARHGVHREPGMPVGHFISVARSAPAVPEPVRAKAITAMENYLEHRFRPAE